MPTVLIIDDADATRAGLVRLFQLRGYTTKEAVNGAEGSNACARSRALTSSSST